MTNSAGPSAPAGWYPDPLRPSSLRFWTGYAWAEPAPAVPPAPERLTAPDGTRWSTVWIWLVVLLPVVPLGLLLVIPWGSLFDIDVAALDSPADVTTLYGPLFSPAYLLASVLGYVSYGLCVYFSYLDYAALRSRGVPKPFHWAWSFLSGVYPFGRSIIVARRTGRGLAPLWVHVGVLALSLAVSLWIAFVVMNEMLEFLLEVYEYARLE